MNAQALERSPWIVLLEMSRQSPDNYEIQKALQERDQFCRDLRHQNHLDMVYARERRAIEALERQL